MLKRLFSIIFKFVTAFFIITILWVVLYKFIPVPVTVTMITNSVKNIGTEKPVFWANKWVGLDEISPSYIKAAIAAEDQKFYTHSGFDFEAIQEAIEHNNKERKKLKGGSTISQQTAKNAFLWQGRTYLRKGLEAYFTALIELIWGKERIIEVYLNIAEMGDGIYGVESASQKYFNTSALHVSKEQAALVIAVLPSPKKYSAKKPGPYVRKRQKWILRQMKNIQLDQEKK
ncbi:MAG: monofunctional biosynthetic peptidoglycan transglycosylase [Chitinophagales bacterium]|nr:monofunctional biosynthetic peptidoglycan transglycosylase [Chitinophagales bacterium]MCZ2392370.1 monofunctional biosynthetic peptidoglycan transglycosylase [Chitinophagales bacterium]